VDGGKKLGDIDVSCGPWSLAFHPSGRRLAVGGSDRLVVLDVNDAGKETRRQRLPDTQWVFTTVAFTPDGKYLGATTYSPGTYLLDAVTLKQLDFLALPKEAEAYAGLTFSADGKRMAFVRRGSSGRTHELLLWEPQTGRAPQLLTTETDGSSIYAVAFAPGGRQIAHGGTHAGPLKLLDLASGETQTFPTHGTGNMWGLAFSPDGKLLGATFSDGSVLLWDVVPDRRPDK
jgi:WD40 repeat protein